ncbi:CDP-alcohol phosphatidyltransferase family protein [Methanooceanicella nereidis]|nr:CDP-alcohol phosphatidyltransferase family protein [Methanocella sp. CWC-04]
MVTIPNIITGFRGLLILLIGVCFFSYSPENDYLRLVAAGLVVLAIISDILDGKIARKLNQESYIGGIMDAAVDMTGFVLGFLLLYFIDTGMRFPAWMVFVVVGREIVVYGFFLYIIILKGRLDKRPHALGRINSFLLAVSIICLLLQFEYSMMIWAAAAILTVLSGIENIHGGYKFLHSSRDTAA